MFNFRDQKRSFQRIFLYRPPLGDNEQIINRPIGISHHKEVRIAKRCDSLNHSSISTIGYLVTYNCRFALLAFQLKVRLTIITEEISYRLFAS